MTTPTPGLVARRTHSPTELRYENCQSKKPARPNGGNTHLPQRQGQVSGLQQFSIDPH